MCDIFVRINFFVNMKKIFQSIRRLRNHMLFRKLFFLYASCGRYYTADEAGREATSAFEWITGEKWVNQF